MHLPPAFHNWSLCASGHEWLATSGLLDLQYRHYKASLEIFKLKPTGDSHEFGNLVGFVSQVRVAPAAERPPGSQGTHCQTPMPALY